MRGGSSGYEVSREYIVWTCKLAAIVRTTDIDWSVLDCRYSTRVSPQFANRMVEAARLVLNRYIPDIYLYTDVYKGEESGK